MLPRSPLAALRNLCTYSARYRLHHQDAVPPKTHAGHPHPQGIYALWAASRISGRTAEIIGPGAHRPFCAQSLGLAFEIIRLCVADLMLLLWTLHPWRSLLLVILELVRGVFPAFRGYSQALLINEVRIF